MTERLPRSPAYAAGRPGMLLLVVLLMLSLFLGIGAILLTIAARARAAAQASAAATTATSFGDALARDALDQALMAALRGAASGTDGAVTINGGQAMESLLADKHGIVTASGTPWFTGTCIGLTSSTTSPLMRVNLEGMSRSPVGSQLNGRILTLMPTAGNGDIASYRILASSGGASPICFVAQIPGASGPVLPSGTAVLPSGTFPVVINGRDFTPASLTGTTPEAFDAYDTATNPFLAKPLITNGTFNGAYGNVSYGIAANATVDNDNDGVNDGVWISGTVIPSQPSPLGGMIRFGVSYLIVDLDGRINLNAAGSWDLSLVSGSHTGAPPTTPIGMGYGPADVNAAVVLRSSTMTNVLLVGGTPSTIASPLPTQIRLPPQVGRIDGRYGGAASARPGVTGDDFDPSQETSGTIGGYSGYTGRILPMSAGFATTTCGTSNAFADIRSRARVYRNALGTLQFQLPDMTAQNSYDWIDDPYEMRLDADGPKFGTPRRPLPNPASNNDDSPYTLTELERVLRPNDPDGSSLPPRLAAALGGSAQILRMQVTTDSWETPLITGTAAALIETNLLSGTVTTGSTPWTVSGTTFQIPSWIRAPNYSAPPSLSWNSTTASSAAETASGLRFNVNRPFSSGSTTPAEKQSYCKGLYTLIACLNPVYDRAKTAQWVANVVDFRDTDADATPFVYHGSLNGGWGSISTGTVAGTVVSGSIQNTGTCWGIERPDMLITAVTVPDPTKPNEITVTVRNPYLATVSSTAGFVPQEVEVIDPAVSGTVPGPAVPRNNLHLQAVTLSGGIPIWRIVAGGTTFSGTGIPLTTSTSFRPLTPFTTGTLRLPVPLGTGTVELQRLAIVSTSAAPNPYITIDTFPARPTRTPQQRPHWPNRPFISHGELMLVPSGTIASDGETSSVSRSLVFDIPEILDATYVPTLFAGHAFTSGSAVAAIGLDELPVDQIPKFREPGRINVNTTPSSSVAGSTDLIWLALTGSTAGAPTFNPFNTGSATNSGTSAASISHLLLTPAVSDLTPPNANDYFRRALSIRLGSSATVRSHVFAIWITVRMTDDSVTPPLSVTKRLFAIVDRSIPVGYLPGRDLNVRDMIKIRTFID